MYRKLGGCAITFGAMKWSLETKPSGETYVTSDHMHLTSKIEDNEITDKEENKE